MKILVTATYYYPYVSGLSILAKRLAEEWAIKGHEVTVLTMKYENNLAETELLNGVRVIRAKPTRKINKGFLSWEYAMLALNLSRKADMVFINLPQPEGIFAAIGGKLAGKKIICFYHCDIQLPQKTEAKLIRGVVDLSSRILLSISDTVIEHTQDYAGNSRVAKYYLYKSHFIFPPVPTPVKNNKWEIKLGKIMNKGKIKIGMAGRIAEDKGVEYVIGALSQISGGHLYLTGPEKPVGEERYIAKINQLVKMNKDNITTLGYLPDEAMGAFYSLIDVLVVPAVNSTEAFGVVQVEAMLSGTPVVVSDLPGVRVPIKKTGMGVLAKPGDSQSIASAIVKVMNHKEKYIKNKARAQKLFNYIKIMERYNQLLQI